ncbi:hypothetical protein R9C00_07320 [Flammeovirgaceae bacterium SG7u.111]|nr:hypothetical protein [Flammeovirgaceae bacterium SG7u.132]WPO37255.1 hypothetical protein R9C00_07320 [Flammeovirgaceae bacterium SG7u.111]
MKSNIAAILIGNLLTSSIILLLTFSCNQNSSKNDLSSSVAHKTIDVLFLSRITLDTTLDKTLEMGLTIYPDHKKHLKYKYTYSTGNTKMITYNREENTLTQVFPEIDGSENHNLTLVDKKILILQNNQLEILKFVEIRFRKNLCIEGNETISTIYFNEKIGVLEEYTSRFHFSERLLSKGSEKTSIAAIFNCMKKDEGFYPDAKKICENEIKKLGLLKKMTLNEDSVEEIAIDLSEDF